MENKTVQEVKYKIELKTGVKKWFNKECEKVERERDTTWQADKRRRTKKNWEKYAKARNKYLLTRRRAERQFEQDIGSKAKKHPKLFHSL